MSIEIIHANVLDFAPDIFDGFDALITDPPYSPRVHSKAVSTRSDGAGPRDRELGFEPLSPELRALIADGIGRVRRWSVLFSDWQSAHLWDDACPRASEPVRWVPWVRWSQPQITGDRPCTGSEAVLVYARRGAKHWNGAGGLVSLDTDEHDLELYRYGQRALRGQDKHPTEKPLDLMLAIVSAFSDPGEAVIDPCAGRGTTALACELLGRDCVAVESNPTECALARERLAHLSMRDTVRAREWCLATEREAKSTPTDGPAYERAMRRLADVKRVQERIGDA